MCMCMCRTSKIKNDKPEKEIWGMNEERGREGEKTRGTRQGRNRDKCGNERLSDEDKLRPSQEKGPEGGSAG